MLLWPLVLYFKSHFIHKNPWFLQGLHRQALGLHNSDNQERSFLKNEPSRSFSRASHSPKAAAGRHDTKHPKICCHLRTRITLRAKLSSNCVSVILCVVCLYFYSVLVLAFNELKHPDTFNRTSFAQNGWYLTEG